MHPLDVRTIINKTTTAGLQDDLVALLGAHSPIPVTYAGGVRDMADLERVKTLGRGRVDVTVGSALDIFGGSLSYASVVAWSKAAEAEAGALSAAAGTRPHASTGGGAASATGGGSSGAGGGKPAGPAAPITHDLAAEKFYVLAPSGEEALLAYAFTKVRAGSAEQVAMDLKRTFVPPAFRGQGMAAKLATAACEFAASSGHAIIPTCSYIRDTFLPAHPQYVRLVPGAASAAGGKL